MGNMTVDAANDQSPTPSASAPVCDVEPFTTAPPAGGTSYVSYEQFKRINHLFNERVNETCV